MWERLNFSIRLITICFSTLRMNRAGSHYQIKAEWSSQVSSQGSYPWGHKFKSCFRNQIKKAIMPTKRFFGDLYMNYFTYFYYFKYGWRLFFKYEVNLELTFGNKKPEGYENSIRVFLCSRKRWRDGRAVECTWL